jgi:hypothetical protein
MGQDLVRAALVYLALIFLAVLPAWTVQSAPMSGRILWTFFAVFALGFMGPALQLAAHTARPKSPASPFARQHWQKFAAAFGIPLLMAELMAIAAMRATLGQNGAEVFEGLAKLDANLFPLVSKFATEMDPPLAPGLLIQAQAVFTAFLLASFITAAGVALLVLVLRPPPPSGDVWERPPRLDLADLLLPPLFTFLLVAALFGWSDFDNHNLNSKGSGILNAYRYLSADNDLHLVGAAFARFVVVLLMLFLLVFWWLRLKALYRPGTAEK